MKLFDKFTFGKHKGESLVSVIESDPTYVEWCIQEIEGFTMSEGAYNILDYSLDEYYEARGYGDDIDIYDFCD